MTSAAVRQWLVDNTTMFPNPQRVCELAEAALGQFPSLEVRIAGYIADDGIRQALMCVHGTLPVVFHGNTFNIPVVFWFPRMFPEHSPLAYVTPTRMMVVKVGKHVDERGRVYHPYLAAWSRDSTLGELFRHLIATFSVEPPVFSRPPGHTGISIKPAGASPRPHAAAAAAAAAASTPTLPHSAVGQASIPPPPQLAPAASLSTPDVRQHPSASRPPAFVQPVASLEAELATVGAASEASKLAPAATTPPPSNAAMTSAEQGLNQLRVTPSTEAPAEPGTSVASSDSVPSPKQQQSAQASSQAPGRLPVPSVGAVHAPPRPLSAADAGERQSQGHGDSGAQTQGLADGLASGGVLAAERDKSFEKSEQPQQIAPPTVQAADSTATIATTTGAAAAAATASAATPTTAVDGVSAGMSAGSAPAPDPKSPVASSLLDDEPMDDPLKRHLGYQLAIYDRVMEAVNRSREKHTRVNKELLDQSANLNSGAGVIAEERHQLLESQRQLSANISVLEHKLNELNEKKAEFPDAAAITDVRKVFCGQTPATDQLFELAGEIAAIDDTLYFLGKALNDGRLPLGTYMRQVRKLAQQQFMAKALAIKIRGLCSLD
ncbi:suppressor protein stp22 of temperature-sensitive alpha-factor receptor and arginine permease [Coemansia biformis]|uniref:Suppressor protein stp22 of temperature-sensitive alpha-factor receptor and arginine permease n=1 Tax=Coemansia biformis TaxID=1286918 RepID=A0A9W7YDP9_9FUNG|nr:suppressor protein stp22 of temperature-sensitive alpha-factor receptor and arginine permease [Coemansia biformis]